MCLRLVYLDRKLPPPDEVITAYKIFAVYNRRLFALHNIGGSTDSYYIFGGRKEYYKVNKWYKNPLHRGLISDELTAYESGYHSFKPPYIDVGMCSNFDRRVYEVSIRNITAVGRQYGVDCYVSQELKINRRIK